MAGARTHEQTHDQPGGTHFPKCVPPEKRRFLFSAFLVFCFLAPFCLPRECATPVRGEPQELTLVLVGDVMLGRGVAQELDGDWEAAFAQVWPWLTGTGGSAEVGETLTFANLESPLTTAPQVSDGYDLRAPLEAVAALSAAGFDVLSLANNHALDAGRAGLHETAATLRAAGIAALVDRGTGISPDQSSPHHVTSHQFPDYQFTNTQFPDYQSINSPTCRFLAFDDSVVPLDASSAAGMVAAAADRADVVVVSVHWGGEYQAAPGPRQRAVARALAAAGADLVVGHGPHVLQRVEWVGETLVAYSLGNFLFDQLYPVDCRWGAILRVTFRGDPVVAVDALPTVAARGRVRPAGPADAAAVLARLALADIEGPGEGVVGARTHAQWVR